MILFARQLLAVLALGLFATSGWAADMWLVSNHFSAERFVPHLHYAGAVMEGDAEALASLFDKVLECDVPALPAEGGNCAVLTLSSPGGNYIEGLKLALLLRERAVATVVEADGRRATAADPQTDERRSALICSAPGAAAPQSAPPQPHRHGRPQPGLAQSPDWPARYPIVLEAINSSSKSGSYWRSPAAPPMAGIGRLAATGSTAAIRSCA